ncbi:unnamed protein product [Cuscuta epithymum]|uniref:Uncharacterized protein n=1 Tax=Cuscuta epithymum TaxID=186058 RepID=A0AAV0CYV7_9ASTE|nr:unnamed protein product [Cuscuta epithymum]
MLRYTRPPVHRRHSRSRSASLPQIKMMALASALARFAAAKFGSATVAAEFVRAASRRRRQDLARSTITVVRSATAMARSVVAAARSTEVASSEVAGGGWCWSGGGPASYRRRSGILSATVCFLVFKGIFVQVHIITPIYGIFKL